MNYTEPYGTFGFVLLLHRRSCFSNAELPQEIDSHIVQQHKRICDEAKLSLWLPFCDFPCRFFWFNPPPHRSPNGLLSCLSFLLQGYNNSKKSDHIHVCNAFHANLCINTFAFCKLLSDGKKVSLPYATFLWSLSLLFLLHVKLDKIPYTYVSSTEKIGKDLERRDENAQRFEKNKPGSK